MKNEILKILKVFMTTYLFIGLTISCGSDSQVTPTNTPTPIPTPIIPTSTPTPDPAMPKTTSTLTPSITPTLTAMPTFRDISTPTPTFTPTITPTPTPSWPPTQTRCHKNGYIEPCLYEVQANDSWSGIFDLFNRDTRSPSPDIFPIPTTNPPYSILYRYINRNRDGYYWSPLSPDQLLFIPSFNEDATILPFLQFKDCNLTSPPCIYQVQELDRYEKIAQNIFGVGYAQENAACISQNNLEEINTAQSITELKEGVLLVIPACDQIDR